MRDPDIVRGQVPSMHLQPRIVVGRRRPSGKRRSRLEVLTTLEAVALGHLALHVDDLAVLRKLSEDSANSEGVKLLKDGCSGCRLGRWESCLHPSKLDEGCR